MCVYTFALCSCSSYLHVCVCVRVYVCVCVLHEYAGVYLCVHDMNTATGKLAWKNHWFKMLKLIRWMN